MKHKSIPCYFCKTQCGGNVGLVAHLRYQHVSQFENMIQYRDANPYKDWPLNAMNAALMAGQTENLTEHARIFPQNGQHSSADLLQSLHDTLKAEIEREQSEVDKLAALQECLSKKRMQLAAIAELLPTPIEGA